jgi:hypothetical protein
VDRGVRGAAGALYGLENVYVRVPNAEEQVMGAVPLTQFGRMCACASLGIQIIAASSPQAKGRSSAITGPIRIGA